MNDDSQGRSPTTVLIVDDSAFMRSSLTRMIGSDPDLRVVGTAIDGTDALEKIAALNPDVVTLDVEMPGLNGVGTLQLIMSRFPRPVIMVSALTTRGAEATLSALSAGAFDYVPKSLASGSLDIAHIRTDLIAKIRAAAASRRKGLSAALRKPPQAASVSSPEASPTAPAIVALGTSTGGPKALEQILPALPKDLSVPILIVQHMPVGFTAPFAERLNATCSVPVREATHQEAIQPGVVYIAPAGLHMTVERVSESQAVICLSPEPAKHQHVPSVDILMRSVAASFRHQAMGVIMTGMGSDGLLGMQAIYRAGGLTLGQDEASCAVYGMPRACAELGVLKRVVPLPDIPAQILQASRYARRVS
jgi:two-component system chemotaxis response regulator CheB